MAIIEEEAQLSMVIVSETLLYVCFSVLIGTLIIFAIPVDKKPGIYVPKWLLLVSVAGVALLSFVPVLQLILHLSGRFGFWNIIEPVLTSFDMGKAWIFTMVISILLFILIKFVHIEQQKPFIYLALSQVLILVLSQGWASHSHAMGQWKGLLAHTVHFLAVCVWVGVLFIVGWFAKNRDHWSKFLSWYSPVAMACVLLTIAAGIAVMNISVSIEEYASAWVLPYGQTLLFKHLFIIPLLVFAFINGFLIQRKLRMDHAFNPIPWARAESILIFIIFTLTAVLGQQAPPHNMGVDVEYLEPSKMFLWFNRGTVDPGVSLIPSMNMLSLFLVLVSFVLLALTVALFKKQTKPVYSIMTSTLFVLASYFALMISV